MKTAGNNRKTTSNRVALYGLLIALAFVLSYVETLFPVYLGAPGVKLGLANLVTVIALYGLGVKEAFAINVVRVLLSGFTFGNMSSILFGMAGAVLSLFLMAVCKKLRLFDMTGISIIGGVAHNRPVSGGCICDKNIWRIFLSSGTADRRNRGWSTDRTFRRDHFKKDQQDLTERIKNCL